MSDEKMLKTMKRLTSLQQLLVQYIQQQGGQHVYMGRSWVPPADSGLSGYTLAGVNLSLKALVRSGVVRVVRDSFFYMSA